ncbi:hypothetical protein PG993_003183 [Apiospora rasikravindrae]|uniref:Uncharacterized protein n=1 Tax=Apiospora rasikravindrae TaxID=990691 RepID=A0ABR1U1G6_9PEZI
MLSKRLEELSRDPSNPDSIVELAVTALGPQGSFYICWKTRSGQYQQDSHGLPPKLQEWLFPPDNSQRDFGSLQVILGPREGEFLASDKNGKVDQKPTEPSPRPFSLNRASTFAPRDSYSTSRSRRISFISDAPEEPDKTSRRRSATLSTLGWASNSNRRTLSLPKVPLDPTETEEQRKSRRTSLLPLTLQAVPSAPVPLSNGFDYSNNTSRTPSRSSSLRSSSSNHSLNSTPPSRERRERRESSGNSQSDPFAPSQQASIPEEPQRTPRVPVVSTPVRRPRPVSCYADACVQTEVVEEEEEPDTPLAAYQTKRRHLRERSSVSSASSVFSAGSDFSSRRTSVASDFKVDDGNCWAEEQQQPVLANPICMGRMQDYFRAGSYQLGDAFTTPSNTYWGSWRQ